MITYLIFSDVTQSCSTTVINHVAKVFADQHATYIKMPEKSESVYIAGEMYQRYGIHGAIGAVDGTHIHISKPSSTGPVLPERFYNRKGYYSVNCMAVCDNQHRIRFWTNRHAGSVHDARIFNESSLKAMLESQFDQSCPLYLLGMKLLFITKISKQQ